jgi:drug/metabolite transporter (DMT)-like permease
VIEQHPLRGIALMLLAVLFFALLDATAKLLSTTFAIPLLVWARYLVHCVLMSVVLGPRLGRSLVATQHPFKQVIRALMLLGCTGFGMAALSRMPLAETTATVFITPLVVALLAGPCLGERITWMRWLGLLAGFAGVVMIARPGGSISADGLVFALLCAACYSIYQIMTRLLSPSEGTLTMLYYTALVGTVTMSLGLPWYWGGPWPEPMQLAMICSLGLFGGTGHFLLISAFRQAPASVLSPALYAQLIWATLLGWLVFNHVPDAWAMGGMLVIAVSGLLLAAFERSTSTPGGNP